VAVVMGAILLALGLISVGFRDETGHETSAKRVRPPYDVTLKQEKIVYDVIISPPPFFLLVDCPQADNILDHEGF